MESRIILDASGAEKLVGKGDMLYAPLGQGKPLRVQGCFITDDEVQAVVDAVKQNTVAEYSEEVMQQIEQSASETGSKSASTGTDTATGDTDEMLPAAVDVILETGQASVSMLQRRLKLGYARAARIVDQMEEMGIVGPFEGSKPRQLLITKEQWAQMQGIEVDDSAENLPVEEEIY
jgi:S-DNA-T family DNA segregation ATPase FtsK/SpoIIIE